MKARFAHLLLAMALPLAVGTSCAKKPVNDAALANAIDGEKAASGQDDGRKVHRCPHARDHFNRAAVRMNVPLYWTSDANGNGKVDPEELVELLFYNDKGDYLYDSAFSRGRDIDTIRQVESWMKDVTFPQGLSDQELARRQKVVEELDQAQPILVKTDFTGLSDREKELVRHLARAGHAIDQLYALQTGSAQVRDNVPGDDLPSQSMFRRNWGSKCLAPQTEGSSDCSAVPGREPMKVGLYPASIQDADAAFCKDIEKDPSLATPFAVVREVKDAAGKTSLKAVPYSEAWPEQMKEIATALRAAAGAVAEDASEKPLHDYLMAAATAFETNDWNPADEAWAAMSGRNSRWYVRIGPDEVYWEPCSLKAGFHFTFARINPEAIAWQDKLTPIRQELENALAAAAGAPYAPRAVSFQLPDFIDIVANYGDDRDYMGATIGQSLPNWGPVANEGRGRTVAMSNLYTDADSLKNRRSGAASLLDESTMAAYTDSATPGLLSTILHEAAHNMGPAHEYRVDGKVDNECFGGTLASTAEELKAQSAAIWYIEKLRKDGIISDKEAREDYVDAITWAFGHISRGMFDGSGRPKHYSQLAAIQVGFFMDEGAITFDGNAMATNGTDKGVFTIHFDRMPAAADKLMKVVAGAKARGDRAALEDLVARYVTGDRVPQALITERLLRYPKASFVYAVDM